MSWGSEKGWADALPVRRQAISARQRNGGVRALGLVIGLGGGFIRDASENVGMLELTPASDCPSCKAKFFHYSEFHVLTWVDLQFNCNNKA